MFWKKKADTPENGSGPQSDILEQAINLQVESVSSKFSHLFGDNMVRADFIIVQYCTFLTAAFLATNDVDFLTVRARSYARRLTGREPITYQEFNNYMQKNPIFSNLSNHVSSTAIKQLIGNGMSLSETKDHLTGIINQLINAKADRLSITCQYCGVSEPSDNLNVKNDTKLYCSDDFDLDQTTGLQIYSLLCFDCRHVTQYAADPLNESGRADDGFEYFRTTKMDLSMLIKFSENAKKHSNTIALNKIEKLIQG